MKWVYERIDGCIFLKFIYFYIFLFDKIRSIDFKINESDIIFIVSGSDCEYVVLKV